MRQGEAGAAIVGLLRHHAIQPDAPARQVPHGALPQRQAKAAAAMLRPDDVATEEAVRRAVAHHADAGDRGAVQLAEPEAAGVGGPEGLGVLRAGVPAFGGGPAQGLVEFRTPHRAADIAGRRLGSRLVGTDHTITSPPFGDRQAPT